MSRFVREPTQLLFTHVPRTGGTWIERALRELRVPAKRWPGQDRRFPSKHLPWPLFPADQQQQVKCVAAWLRYPTEYYEATWRWMNGLPIKKVHKLANLWEWHPHKKAAMLYDTRFQIWARRIARAEPGWVTRVFEAYVGPEGAEWADWIGRTETLERDFFRLMDRVGVRIPEKREARIRELGRVNAAAKVECRWDSGVRRVVEEQEKTVIERFWSARNLKRREYNRLRMKEVAIV